MRSTYALILATACGLASAATPTPAQQSAVQHISADSLRGHLSFLASDLLEGRGTPSRGQDIAAEYIATQFRRAGLEPVGDDGYFQTAKWQAGARDMSKYSFTIDVDGQHLTIPAQGISLEGASGATAAQAGIVRISSPDAQIAPGSLDGRIVLIDLAQNLDGASIAKARRNIGEALRASKPLLRMSIDRHHAYGNGGASLAVVDPEEVAARGPAPVNIMLHDAAAIAAIEHAKGPISASLQIPAADLKPVKLRNVIGVLRGSDPALKDSYVMVTAHYDHLGIVNGKIHNGANDDGSGTVSVIELASVIAAMPQRPKRSMVFMTVFGEELGLRGSRYYGRHPVIPLAKTVADVNLEQMGRTDDSEGPQVKRVAMTGFDYSDIGPIFQAAGKATGVEVFKHPQNSDRYFAQSDNQALADVGVPAHTLSVAYEFPDYHGAGDKWDKIDYENMAQVDRMVLLGLLEIANSATAPKWNAANPMAAKYREAAAKLVP